MNFFFFKRVQFEHFVMFNKLIYYFSQIKTKFSFHNTITIFRVLQYRTYLVQIKLKIMSNNIQLS